MTVHDLRFQGAVPSTGLPGRRRQHPLAQLDLEHFGKRVVVFTPSGRTLSEIVTQARRDISTATSAEVVRRVASANPDSIWAIARKDRYDALDPHAEGFVAFLMLDEKGFRDLTRGTLDPTDPDLNAICTQNSKPAAIYVWALQARGSLAAGIALVFEKLGTPLYQDVDIYARPATEDGARFLETLGFSQLSPGKEDDAPNLHVFRRSNRWAEAPSYDTHGTIKAPDAVTVTVARGLDDLMKAISIRSAVFLAEQDCPYSEEFDGNDFSAVHMIGYVGDEPGGSLRIRYFADFAKIERLAVRHEFRNAQVAAYLVHAAIELCRAKGYGKIYGHAQKRLVPFWSRFGFSVFSGAREFVFSDFDYVEMMMDAEPKADAVVIGVDPYVIVRPEGRWHRPGVLEKSSVRPVTRPTGRSR